MSLERVLKTLEGFGLSRVDAKMYVYLAKMGPQNASELSEALKITKQQLYPRIKCLRDKGIIAASVGQPLCSAQSPSKKHWKYSSKPKWNKQKPLKKPKKSSSPVGDP